MKDNYILKETEDGSYSLYSNDFQELMHTISGAYSEAMIKHVIPSGVLNLNLDSINILDVGFGCGYNIFALLNEFEKKGFPFYLKIVSLELDRSIGDYLGSIVMKENGDLYKNILISFKEGFFKNENYEIKLLFGDAREHIVTFDESTFDVVFQDAFSPGKNPELWSLDYFKVIRYILKDGGLLTTYSAAPQVRRALAESGFFLKKGPQMGRKREGTLAVKSKEKNSPDFMDQLYSNIKSEPYRDTFLNNTREVLLNERLEKIKDLRQEKKSI